MNELLETLVRASLWLALAVLVLAALRPLLLRLGGPLLAYRSWWLLPLLLLAPLLPAAPLQPATVLPGWQAALHAQVAVGGPTPPAWMMVVLLVWGSGVVLVLLRAWRAQRGFERRLGRLHLRADGSWQAEADPGLPALVGLWRPRIVVGPAFDVQFDADERVLVLRHERNHRRHGDHWANAALLVLRSLLWFHPLLPWAAGRFLRDQELACDAHTIGPHPALRRAYATALLKTQMVPRVVPMACHWRCQPLLKERITMIKQSQRKTLQRISGQMLVVALCAGLATLAWAGQAHRDAHISTRPAAVAAGGQAQDAQVRDMPPPRYPAAAFEQGQTGEVLLQVEVDAQGRVSGVRVLRSSNPVFDAPSIEAASRWTFEPAMKDGKPVAGAVRVPITYSMDEAEAAAESVG